MTTDSKLRRSDSPAVTESSRPWSQALAGYQRELTELRRSEMTLRGALACEDALLHQKDELIRLLEMMSKESDHRFLNSLQMIASLLSMQARTTRSPEAASQLAIAADRVVRVGCIHRRLHSCDNAQTTAFKPFLEGLCEDFTAMLALGDEGEQAIDVDAIELELPIATSIPLGFIASELITNAGKYGRGRIHVRLERDPGGRFALSVSNDGPVLPEGFDPAASKGLGMTIIRSLVAKIGGALSYGRGDHNQGTRFIVMFGPVSASQATSAGTTGTSDR